MFGGLLDCERAGKTKRRQYNLVAGTVLLTWWPVSIDDGLSRLRTEARHPRTTVFDGISSSLVASQWNRSGGYVLEPVPKIIFQPTFNVIFSKTLEHSSDHLHLQLVKARRLWSVLTGYLS